jgi:hypothetical protein
MLEFGATVLKIGYQINHKCRSSLVQGHKVEQLTIHNGDAYGSSE